MRRGLARSRGEARDLVTAGLVTVGGAPAAKPAHPVEPTDDDRRDRDGPRWVGRAAHKLVAALDDWGPQGLAVAGRRCVDVGASTGGFTQVLLAPRRRHASSRSTSATASWCPRWPTTPGSSSAAAPRCAA